MFGNKDIPALNLVKITHITEKRFEIRYFMILIEIIIYFIMWRVELLALLEGYLI